jgi:hypothetical protein
MVKIFLAVITLTSFVGVVAALPDPIDDKPLVGVAEEQPQHVEPPRCFGQTWPFFNKGCLRKTKPATKGRLEEYQREAASPSKAEDGSLAIVTSVLIQQQSAEPSLQRSPPARTESDDNPRLIEPTASKPTAPKIPVIPPLDPQYLPQSGPSFELVKNGITIPMPSQHRFRSAGPRLRTAGWQPRAPGFGPAFGGRQPPPPARVGLHPNGFAPSSAQAHQYFVRQGGGWVPINSYTGPQGRHASQVPAANRSYASVPNYRPALGAPRSQ